MASAGSCVLNFFLFEDEGKLLVDRLPDSEPQLELLFASSVAVMPLISLSRSI
jgi:hypothetical protein